MKIKKDILWRVGILYLGMVLLALYILLQMFRLQFVEGSKWREKQAMLSQEDVTIEAERGAILSDDGRKLACSVPSYRIYMDMRAGGLTDEVFRRDIDSLSIRLSSFFRDRSPAAYKRALSDARRKNNRYYQVNSRRVSFVELKKIKQFPIFRLGSNKGGFVAVQFDTRKMPFGSLASRTVGKMYMDKGRGGMVGVEEAYDTELKGRDGVGNKLRIAGLWVNDVQVEPIDGDDVVTTINVEIQDLAEKALKEQLVKHNARYGVAIVMEVKTGAVKAMVNLHRSAPGVYSEDHFNYAIAEATEPGSTFKLASMMVAMEDGLIDLDDVVDAEGGSYQYYDRTMHDSGDKKLGQVTMKEAFEKSSNVGISKIIFHNYKKDPAKFIDGLEDLGITRSLEIEIKGETQPYVKRPVEKSWSGISLPWMSIGYEVKLTPLQILTFYNAIANGGTMVRPMFVQGISRHGNMQKSFGTEVIQSSVCSRRTLKKVRELLIGVVENGTAKNLHNPHYQIAGKTGTAQVAKGSKGYGTKGWAGAEGVSYQASFAGYFPAEKPMYSCVVVVNGPSNNVYYGNVVAGSVFKKISDHLYAVNYKNSSIYKEPEPHLSKNLPVSKGGKLDDVKRVLSDLDIEYDKDNVDTEWVGTNTSAEVIKLTAKKIDKGLVPNVKGLGARDAVALLEKEGLRVIISGAGRVISQSQGAGSPLRKGSTIVLKLG